MTRSVDSTSSAEVGDAERPGAQPLRPVFIDSRLMKIGQSVIFSREKGPMTSEHIQQPCPLRDGHRQLVWSDEAPEREDVGESEGPEEDCLICEGVVYLATATRGPSPPHSVTDIGSTLNSAYAGHTDVVSYCCTVLDQTQTTVSRSKTQEFITTLNLIY